MGFVLVFVLYFILRHKATPGAFDCFLLNNSEFIDVFLNNSNFIFWAHGA